MSNFTDFFPAAGGGGGFTKMNKYSTNRAIGGDTVIKLSNSGGPPSGVTFQFRAQSVISAGATSFTAHQLKFDNADIPAGTAVPANAYKGFKTTFPGQGGVATDVTILTSAAFTAAGNGSATSVMTFTPALTQNMDVLSGLTFTPILTVNPATDLGLSDGDSLGYFLCGAGNYNGSGGGKGGKINYGTAIISNASTDLVLTPGVANSGNSTITGGLTLTSGDGSNMAGGSADTTPDLGGYSGILGYGAGGGDGSTSVGSQGGQNHGWGGGGFEGESAGDGAILLNY